MNRQIASTKKKLQYHGITIIKLYNFEIINLWFSLKVKQYLNFWLKRSIDNNIITLSEQLHQM